MLKIVSHGHHQADLIKKLLRILHVQGFAENPCDVCARAFSKLLQNSPSVGIHSILFNGNTQIADDKLQGIASFLRLPSLFLRIQKRQGTHRQKWIRPLTIPDRPKGRSFVRFFVIIQYRLFRTANAVVAADSYCCKAPWLFASDIAIVSDQSFAGLCERSGKLSEPPQRQRTKACYGNKKNLSCLWRRVFAASAQGKKL
jgi:hypothetical protein